MTFRVRPAAPEDAKAITAMIVAHNDESGQPSGRIDPRKLRAVAFGKSAFVFCEVAEGRDAEAGDLVGHAIWHDCYTSDDGSRGAYLVDLFVARDWRRQGVGAALMKATARRAKARGATHLWWASLADNKAARKFYRRFGATDEIVHAHAAFGEAFRKLAAPARR